jgi:hypothetical protein
MQMESTQRLTWDQLAQLSARFAAGKQASAGVLSVYLQLPAAVRHERRRWQTTLNSGLTELRAKYRGDRVLDRLAEEAAAQLQGLPPDARAAGVILLLSADGTRWLETTLLPVGTSFAWHRRPVLQPIVTALHAAPTTGVMVLAQEQARLMTWDQGILREEVVLTADVDTTDWRRHAAGAVSGTSQQTSTHVDDFQARFDEQIDKFVRGLASEVAERARQHHWQLVMPVTAAKLAEPITMALGPQFKGRLLPSGDVNLIRAGNEALADHVTTTLANWTADRQDEEVAAAIGTARSRGPAALGPADCLGLLAQSRVAHLMYAGDMQMTGYLREDGMVSLDPDPTAGDQTVAEDLAEWAIAACLAAGTKVTPVFGAASERLAAADGMVATLHY